MVDRVVALQQLETLGPALNVTAERAFEKALNKAIALAMSGVELSEARKADPPTQRNIKSALADCLTMAELKKVSKKWEPKRTVTSATSHQELVGQLTELLDARRVPFQPPKMSLAQARSFDQKEAATLVYQIENLCTPAQTKSLLKKWDKHNKALLTRGTEAQSNHLVALLNNEVEPSAKP